MISSVRPLLAANLEQTLMKLIKSSITHSQKKANIIGVAFHVGSNCKHIPSYKKGIEDAGLLFKYAKEKWGQAWVLRILYILRSHA